MRSNTLAPIVGKTGVRKKVTKFKLLQSENEPISILVTELGIVTEDNDVQF
jgi:hypothetical protein